MKSSVFNLVLVLLVSVKFSAGYIRWQPSLWGCFDCYGFPRREGESYFDGCNWCVCSWRQGSACSLMNCEYNQCYKRM